MPGQKTSFCFAYFFIYIDTGINPALEERVFCLKMNALAPGERLERLDCLRTPFLQPPAVHRRAASHYSCTEESNCCCTVIQFQGIHASLHRQGFIWRDLGLEGFLSRNATCSTTFFLGSEYQHLHFINIYLPPKMDIFPLQKRFTPVSQKARGDY